MNIKIIGGIVSIIILIFALGYLISMDEIIDDIQRPVVNVIDDLKKKEHLDAWKLAWIIDDFQVAKNREKDILRGSIHGYLLFPTIDIFFNRLEELKNKARMAFYDSDPKQIKKLVESPLFVYHHKELFMGYYQYNKKKNEIEKIFDLITNPVEGRIKSLEKEILELPASFPEIFSKYWWLYRLKLIFIQK